MNRRLAYSACVVAVGILSSAASGAIPPWGDATRTSPSQRVAGLPRGFIENRGQVESSVRYYAHGTGVSVYFTAGGVILDRRRPAREDHQQGCAVGITFEGANPNPKIEARGVLPTRYNFFLGSDASMWRTDVPIYSEVVYIDLWPGIDLVYRVEPAGIQYELLARPGANMNAPSFRYEGADRVSTETSGARRIETSVGAIEDSRPDGFHTRGHVTFPISTTGWGALPLTEAAHPTDNPASLLWSTFLGGSGHDAEVGDIAVATSDRPIVTGTTESADFPVTTGAYDVLFGGTDIFVAEFDPIASTLIWCTFLGGSDAEYNDGQVIALDAGANPIVMGRTYSLDFPTTSGAYSQTNTGANYFLTKLDSSGSALLWSTFLWTNAGGAGFALTIDPSGNPVVTGSAASDFPATAGAYDTSLNGLSAAFVAKLDSSGSSLLWGTYLGGIYNASGAAITLDAAGAAVVTGSTDSPDFPTTSGAYDGSLDGPSDGFVAKVSATGSALLWSTFLGGTDFDTPFAVKLDSNENAVVLGGTASSDFPTTTGAYDTSLGGTGDMFVTSLAANGSALVWSTYLGGSGEEAARDLLLDPFDSPIVTGWTDSSDYPTAGAAFDTSFNGSGDAVVSQLSSSGGALVWSTFLGAGSIDVGYGIDLDSSSDPVIVGGTSSTGFPTTPGAYDQTFNGGMSDIFVAKFDLPNEPTPILLQSFTAAPAEDGVFLQWILSADIAVGGFDLYRRSGASQAWEKINPAPILGGPEYEYLDVAVEPGQSYEYAIEWIDDRGRPMRIGSVSIDTGIVGTVSLRIAPNPTHGDAAITFHLPVAGAVRLSVVDVSGREVGIVANTSWPAGTHTLTWNGRDGDGRLLPGGVYYTMIQTPSGNRSRPVLLIR